MLKIYVTTPDCVGNEAYLYDIPLGTPWSDIQTLCQLVHPDLTEVIITVEE